MRLSRLVPAAILVAVVLAGLETGSAQASFHCMRIHAVMGGFHGDADIQYVELRMAIGSQTLVGGHTMRFYDGSDTLKATFTFPGNAGSGSNGSSILVASAEFDAQTAGGSADVVFSGANTAGANGGDPLHPVQSPGGRVVFAGEGSDFNCNTGAPPVDAVAYGSATATFGTAASALPSPSDGRALRLNNLNTKPSNNSTEYSLENVSGSTFTVSVLDLKTDVETPRNNSRVVLDLIEPVGGVAEAPGLDAATLEEGAGSGSTPRLVAIVAALAAAAVISVAAGAWYARRRIVARASWWDEQT